MARIAARVNRADGASQEACSEGFPPVARSDARVLILGSLPGRRSIDEQQYYAHPQNAFWPIMNVLLGAQGDYDSRLEKLADKRVALWDVLRGSVRKGSLDSSIQLDTARVNDFEAFLGEHRDIRLIVFNGKKAEQLFHRWVEAHFPTPSIEKTGLPSTSPAYASMPFSVKLMRWRQAIEPHL